MTVKLSSRDKKRLNCYIGIVKNCQDSWMTIADLSYLVRASLPTVSAYCNYLENCGMLDKRLDIAGTYKHRISTFKARVAEYNIDYYVPIDSYKYLKTRIVKTDIPPPKTVKFNGNFNKPFGLCLANLM